MCHNRSLPTRQRYNGGRPREVFVKLQVAQNSWWVQVYDQCRLNIQKYLGNPLPIMAPLSTSMDRKPVFTKCWLQKLWAKHIRKTKDIWWAMGTGSTLTIGVELGPIGVRLETVVFVGKTCVLKFFVSWMLEEAEGFSNMIE